jgi:hypothetical protein
MRILALILSWLALVAAGWECPLEGTGGDPANNLLKNRTIVPGSYQHMAFETLRYLDVPEGISRKHRSTWPLAARQELAHVESGAVSVVGYLLAVKLEGREATNCEADEPEHRDFHLWLANSPHDEKAEAVVVEISPRLRALHATWNAKALGLLVKQQTKVRISGWLFLDPEHPDQVGKTRATIWEIHPITEIEIWRDAAWRPL